MPGRPVRAPTASEDISAGFFEAYLENDLRARSRGYGSHFPALSAKYKNSSHLMEHILCTILSALRLL